MRHLLITKWIQELNREIEFAKKRLDLHKLSELRWLKDDLVLLRDKIN